MRPMILAAALLALAFVPASPRPASACTCTSPPTLQAEFDAAYKVFSGRVLWMSPGLDGMVEVMFEPLQRWKGSLETFVLAVTAENEGVCGYPFVVGGEYLVFGAYFPYGITLTPRPLAHLCTRTAPLEGNPYLAQLPPPLLPTPAATRSWGTLKLRYR